MNTVVDEAAHIKGIQASRLETSTVILIAAACIVPWVAVSLIFGTGAAFAFVRAKSARRLERRFLIKAMLAGNL